MLEALLMGKPSSGNNGSAPGTVALMHFDGTAGSQVFSDVYGHTFTANAGAVLSATAKFGSGGLSCPAAASYISTPDSTDFRLTSDFTIEFFARLADVTTANSFPVAKGAYACIQFYNGTIYVRPDSSSYVMSAIPHGQAANTWFHVALTKQGSTWRLFVQGILKSSATSALTWGSNTNVLSIGNAAGYNYAVNGILDELRIVNGIAVYTANFTPPSAPFTS